MADSSDLSRAGIRTAVLSRRYAGAANGCALRVSTVRCRAPRICRGSCFQAFRAGQAGGRLDAQLGRSHAVDGGGTDDYGKIHSRTESLVARTKAGKRGFRFVGRGRVQLEDIHLADAIGVAGKYSSAPAEALAARQIS